VTMAVARSVRPLTILLLRTALRRRCPSLPVFANLSCGSWYVNPLRCELKTPQSGQAGSSPHPKSATVESIISVSERAVAAAPLTCECCNRLISADTDTASIAAPTSSNDTIRTAAASPADTLLTCYFKSQDGHPPHWQFYPARLNREVALSAARNGGVIIADSTRKGKRFPDSMSRTIPIWCCVINRLLHRLPDQHAAITSQLQSASIAGPQAGVDWDTALHTPSWVSASEHQQIDSRIEGWVQSLLQITALQPTFIDLKRLLTRPLRPLWFRYTVATIICRHVS